MKSASDGYVVSPTCGSYLKPPPFLLQLLLNLMRTPLASRLFAYARSAAVPVVTLALALLLTTACDTTEDDTIVLNDRANPTTATYEFEYDPRTAVGGQVGVTSASSDDLNSVLQTYGYSRSDIISARVEEVRISQSTGGSAVTTPKLYDYINEIALYLGTSDSAPALAEPQPVSSGLNASLNASGAEVTSVLRSGASRAFLVIDVENTREPQGFVEATITYEIEVQP